MIALGIIIIAAGWFFLTGGVGVGSGGMMVANLHLISIANNVILFGYFLVIAGLLREGIKRLPAPVAEVVEDNRSKFDREFSKKKGWRATEQGSTAPQEDPAMMSAVLEDLKAKPTTRIDPT